MEAICFDTTSADINNQHTDDIAEFQESGKHTFITKNLHTYWCHTKWKGTRVSLNLPSRFALFVKAYLCELALSILVGY